ncbi:MAG: sigma-70 family RNA polymerase sigma factor [Planctomycetia bacterium]|nr:sigma-70 family RNA polymerase sigma factor [Planctomycetia bacterium]
MSSEQSAQLDSELLERLRADPSAWDGFLREHRLRLRRMIALRLDRRLQGRLDASDVIQDAYTEATARLSEYLSNPTLPPYLWLRFIACQRLLISARRHLGAEVRNAAREEELPHSTADGLAAHLVDHATGPLEKAEKAEALTYLRTALAAMDDQDRDVLTLRHFEQLSNLEAATVLGIEPSAASKRYIRALSRLQEILANRAELFERFRP